MVSTDSTAAQPANNNKPAHNLPLIKDTTTQDFMTDVVEASKQVPVLVDFWAPWCGPCRQLGPVIEKAVKAARGRVVLVKMNIDEHPAVANQLGVQSIPAVFAFKDGQPVDGFMGAQPESQITAFINRITKGGGSTALSGPDIEEGHKAFEAGDIQGAAEIYANILRQDQSHSGAIAGLAQCYVKLGDLEKAETTLSLVAEEDKDADEIKKARLALDLARKGNEAGDVAALEAELAKNADNHQARFDLALARNAQGDRKAAMAHLFTIMERDRNWNDDAARKQLVEFFEAWSPTDPATVEGRRKLSSLLFA